MKNRTIEELEARLLHLEQLGEGDPDFFFSEEAENADAEILNIRIEIEQRKCSHHPYDRELDDAGNQICGTCGKVMKTAAELWGDDDDEYTVDYLD